MCSYIFLFFAYFNILFITLIVKTRQVIYCMLSARLKEEFIWDLVTCLKMKSCFIRPGYLIKLYPVNKPCSRSGKSVRKRVKQMLVCFAWCLLNQYFNNCPTYIIASLRSFLNMGTVTALITQIKPQTFCTQLRV